MELTKLVGCAPGIDLAGVEPTTRHLDCFRPLLIHLCALDFRYFWVKDRPVSTVHVFKFVEFLPDVDSKSSRDCGA